MTGLQFTQSIMEEIKMTTINYQITFFSEWHAGSGLTSGSDVDALVIKDKNGLPYIPGKTLKGLLKEATIQILELQDKHPKDEKIITELFGYAEDNKPEDEAPHNTGQAFFTNAVLNENLRDAIIKQDIAGHFYRSTSSTAIEDSGIAKEHSLRKAETVIPCRLEAEIHNVENEFIEHIEQSMKWIKRLGKNRNRGLGRCKFEITNKEEVKA